MTRTDVHAPSNLVTEDYSFAYAYDAHPEEGDRRYTMPILHALLDQGWRFGQVHGGDTCDHCGARLRYVAVLKHEPTHTLIKVGETCLDNRFQLATAEFHKLRKAAKLNRDRMKLSEKLAKWLDSDDDNRAAYVFLTDQVHEGNYGWNGFYFDLLHKANRYGDLSERQVEAALKAKARDEEYAARRAAEAEQATDVIEGKVEIEGMVLSTKWVENAYGSTLKMLVKDDRGFKVWGSVPNAIREIDAFDEDNFPTTRIIAKGDRVAFSATVGASRDDSTFGYYKRPTKARLVSEGALEGAQA